MSAPVNVLAVLDRTAAGLHSVASSCMTDMSTPMREHAEDVDRTRVAVAELMVTQRDTLRMLEAAQRQLGIYSAANPRILRARAALANVGGAA